MKVSNFNQLIIAVVSVWVVACGEHNHLKTVPCHGGDACSDKANAPACGDIDSGECRKNAVDGQGKTSLCTYLLMDQASCPCMEGDLQYCGSGSGGNGGRRQIEECVRTKPHEDATSWGGCHD